MQVAIVVFDGVTVLDAVGPYEVLGWLPEADVRLVGIETGPVRSGQGTLAVCADYTLEDVPAPDVVLVPGGPGEETLRRDPEVLRWLRDAHATSKWTTSVCTGACTLAAAGLLDGLEATTHWSSMEVLRRLGAVPVERRWVRSGRILTAAGVSAGIDMALHLLATEAGDGVAQAAQLVLEYDPQPPFDSGSPAKAPPHIVARLRERFGAPETPPR
ncbi:MAG: DJ-1/PfpI family protein [Acidimicrobiia bacterium]